MTSLPFDPVKALDLSHTPPSAALDNNEYADPPSSFWLARGNPKQGHSTFFVTAIISIDAFSCASVVSVLISEARWRAFVAQCILRGLPRPIALVRQRTDAAYILCPALFRSGFTSVREHPRESEYTEAANEARCAT